MSNNFKIFAIFSFPVLLFAIVFNACGIFLLKSLPGSDVTQTIIIINLSISEILIAVGWIGELVADIVGLTLEDRALLIVWAIRAGVYCFWFFVMYILSLDRFMSCVLALKHRAMVTKKRLRHLMTSLWTLCALSCLFLLVFDTSACHNIYNKFVWISLDAIAVLIYSLTYISIFAYNLKRERMKRVRTHSLESQENPSRINLHFFKIVGLIIISFIIFEVVPSVTEMSFFWNGSAVPEALEGFIALFYQLILLIDPLIYIFMQSKVRRLLFAKIYFHNDSEGAHGICCLKIGQVLRLGGL